MYLLNNRQTFMVSAENPTGMRNGGTRGKDCEKLHAFINIAPGETATICDVDGPAVLTHFWIGGLISHTLIMRIYWENSEFPSVEVPLSAFFGFGYDDNIADRDGNYLFLNSAMIMMTPAVGTNCYFPMPFLKHCKITMENRGPGNAGCYYAITGHYDEALPQNISYFHATYRQEHPVQKGRSYVILDNVQGRGRFMGCILYAGINGHNTCWVEGEAKMYIDGEQYPSLNYTGTEDYFCGSFAFGNDNRLQKYQTYSGLYAGMYGVLGNSREMYNNQQRFMLYRWHVPDEIYFNTSFKMVIDNLGWTGPRYDDYTTVAYYYLDKPGKPPFVLPPDHEIIMR